MTVATKNISLLTSNARIQTPWIKVVIGTYTFGVYSRHNKNTKDNNGFYTTTSSVQYPNYVKSLNISKVNGQVNQYTLILDYPVTQTSDPNFFEKVLSSVSGTRKIVFSYGDMSQPNYIFKDEEAIITKVSSNFSLTGSVITYTVYATSSAALNKSKNCYFNGGYIKPSERIREIVSDLKYGLGDLFPAMNSGNLNSLIPSDDKVVYVNAKSNIAPIDYVSYLVSCMIPASYTTAQTLSDTYVLTLHDDTVFDTEYINGLPLMGPYFKISRMSNKTASNDAYTIDIGFGNGNSTIVTQFSVNNDENYSLLYNYTTSQDTDEYKQVLDSNGEWKTVWSPTITSKNSEYETRSEDIAWWSKVTQYPIKATITVQGLIRPALLTSYIRLNIIFVGGRKHISSGLYMVTKQEDKIDASGYRTTLNLTKISGDNNITL